MRYDKERLKQLTCMNSNEESKIVDKDKWWGKFQFAINDSMYWRIGERSIIVKRSQREWTIWNKQTDAELKMPIKVGKTSSDEQLLDDDCSRYILAATNEVLEIEPSLADRAMIVKPAIPLIVSPNEQIEMFVSTPLWLTVLIPSKDKPIADIPFWRPSDSWFGPSTQTGDLCYSKYTDAKLDESLLELRAYRATTKVMLTNELEEPLVLERLNLPVPALKLYVDKSNRFWSDEVSILQTEEHGKSVSRVKHFAPKNSTGLLLVSESRELSKKSSFLSSIKSLVN